MYERIIQAVFSSPWAIQEHKLQAMIEFLQAKQAGEMLQYEAADQRQPSTTGGVQTIPMVGVISQRMNMMSEFSGGVSTDKIGRQIRDAVNDPNISAIVLDVDSPGGSVAGVQELAEIIRKARDQKPIVAVANSLAASAGYWLASSATELSVTPSGEVGSIGVIALHVDYSQALEAEGITPTYIYAGEYKKEGNPYEPLEDEAMQYLQSMINSYYNDFISAVSKGRNVPVETVRADFGRGRTLRARDAVKAGMADRVETLDDAISRISKPRNRSRLMSAYKDYLDVA